MGALDPWAASYPASLSTPYLIAPCPPAGINEPRFTQHLLIECIDFRTLREKGRDLAEVRSGKGRGVGAAVQLSQL